VVVEIVVEIMVDSLRRPAGRPDAEWSGDSAMPTAGTKPSTVTRPGV
jgi:hypothetical protein